MQKLAHTAQISTKEVQSNSSYATCMWKQKETVVWRER